MGESQSTKPVLTKAKVKAAQAAYRALPLATRKQLIRDFRKGKLPEDPVVLDTAITWARAYPTATRNTGIVAVLLIPALIINWWFAPNTWFALLSVVGGLAYALALVGHIWSLRFWRKAVRLYDSKVDARPEPSPADGEPRATAG